MSSFINVDPANIEKTLCNLYQTTHKIHKTRASLFNFIVYVEDERKKDYIHSVLKALSKNFPCRIIYIILDNKTPFPTTSVSLINNDNFSCDFIEIKASKDKSKEIFYLILPTLIPDLSTYLFWPEDPCKKNELFFSLKSLSSKVIFDSEEVDSLDKYIDFIFNFQKENKQNVVDLNWSRITPWRTILAFDFNSEKRIDFIKNCSQIDIHYNASKDPYFCKLKIRSLFLQAWLASKLEWQFSKIEKIENDILLISYLKDIKIRLIPKYFEKLTPGSISQIDISSKNNNLQFIRNVDDNIEEVNAVMSSHHKCKMPIRYLLEPTFYGASLAREIYNLKESTQYTKMLQILKKMPILC